MRLIDGDALYAKLQEHEELARKRVWDTTSTLPLFERRKVMAGREELYLKHIDENTGRIAKALEYMVEREKEIKAEKDQWAKEKEEMAKKRDEYDEVAELIRKIRIGQKEESDDKNRT